MAYDESCQQISDWRHITSGTIISESIKRFLLFSTSCSECEWPSGSPKWGQTALLRSVKWSLGNTCPALWPPGHPGSLSCTFPCWLSHAVVLHSFSLWVVLRTLRPKVTSLECAGAQLWPQSSTGTVCPRYLPWSEATCRQYWRFLWLYSGCSLLQQQQASLILVCDVTHIVDITITTWEPFSAVTNSLS